MPQDVTPAVTLRSCTPADAPTLALAGAATFLEAFAGFIPGDSLLAHCRNKHTPEAYVALFAQPETRAWLAEIAAAPIGYALLTTPDFPPGLLAPADLELRRIYLFTRFHGTGTARALMELAVAAARQQGARRLLLGVHPENYRALAFYRRTGFVEVGERRFQVGASIFVDPVLALTL